MATVLTSGSGFNQRAAINTVDPTVPTMSETVPAVGSCFGIIGTFRGIDLSTRITLIPGTYTTVTYEIGSTQGVTLANTFIGVYDITGTTQLGATSDISTALAAVTTFAVGTATLNSTILVAADYWITFLFGSAVTAPKFCGSSPGSGAGAFLAPKIAARSAATNLTSLPGSLDVTSSTAVLPFYFRYQ